MRYLFLSFIFAIICSIFSDEPELSSKLQYHIRKHQRAIVEAEEAYRKAVDSADGTIRRTLESVILRTRLDEVEQKLIDRILDEGDFEVRQALLLNAPEKVQQTVLIQDYLDNECTHSMMVVTETKKREKRMSSSEIAGFYTTNIADRRFFIFEDGKGKGLIDWKIEGDKLTIQVSETEEWSLHKSKDSWQGIISRHTQAEGLGIRVEIQKVNYTPSEELPENVFGVYYMSNFGLLTLEPNGKGNRITSWKCIEGQLIINFPPGKEIKFLRTSNLINWQSEDGISLGYRN